MAAKLLLDTGAFVALIDRSELQHANCVMVLEAWTGPVVTTEAVLTETLYLLGKACAGSAPAAVAGSVYVFGVLLSERFHACPCVTEQLTTSGGSDGEVRGYSNGLC